MSRKVIPFPRPIISARPRPPTPPYPIPDDGVHLAFDGMAWCLSKHLGGQSVSMRLTREELLRVAAMIELATTLEDV